MTLKVLHANGTITDAGSAGITIVGTNPLADADTATYVACPYMGVIGFTAGLEPLVGYQVGDPISLHISIRIQATGPPLDVGEGQVYITTDAAGVNEIAGFSDGMTSGFGFHIPLVVGTLFQELVIPLRLASWPTSLPDLVAALEAGAYLDFNFLTNGVNFDTPGVIVYEASVWVGEPARVPPNRRQYPYPGTRVYPPVFTTRGGTAAIV